MERTKLRRTFGLFLKKYGKKKIAIATHSRADVDALASAFALSRVIRNSIICTYEEMGDGAKMLAERLGIEVHDIESVQKDEFEGLVLTDTSAYTLIPPAREWKVLCVIDHHRKEGKDISAEFEIIDPESPSACEIVATIAPKTDEKTAFALSVGIIADGARFKSARQETFEILAMLMKKAGAGYQELLRIAEPEPKDEAKIAILSAMKRIEIIYSSGYIIATSEVGSNESDAAALIVEAADVAFVAKWKNEEKETRISARARKNVRVPLNEVMSEVSKALGGAGGGHKKAAGASLKCHTSEALKKCVEVFMAFAERS